MTPALDYLHTKILKEVLYRVHETLKTYTSGSLSSLERVLLQLILGVVSSRLPVAAFTATAELTHSLLCVNSILDHTCIHSVHKPSSLIMLPAFQLCMMQLQ